MRTAVQYHKYPASRLSLGVCNFTQKEIILQKPEKRLSKQMAEESMQKSIGNIQRSSA